MSPSPKRAPLYLFAGLSAGALVLVALLWVLGESGFEEVMGGLPPLGVFVVAPAIGGVLLFTVLDRYGFSVMRRDRPGGWMLALKGAAALGAVGMVLDLMVVLPRDINVPFPHSLAFYPAMAFLAENVFHLVPLSIALVPLAFIKQREQRKNFLLLALAATALPETLYQGVLIHWLWDQGRKASALVALHVLAINAVGLWLFLRFDFIRMWGFRLLYYLFFHIAWGAARLSVLF